MSDFKTDSGKYTPHDFLLWNANDILEISPKFQRRPVWRTPAKSFLIDTILRGMTVPPIYMRLKQNAARTKAIREVVDGQQRIRAVLGFMADEFRLSSTLEGPWAGKKFSQLDSDEQVAISEYTLTTETFKGVSDADLFEVFCRLNMNGVPLNKQELRNGKFFGRFKRASYALAYSHLEFWRQHRIFTEMGIARMLEVELTSELLIAANLGMQDKKESINDFYRAHEDKYPTQKTDKRRFNEVMATISEACEGDLADSQFRRPPLFYTLYCVVYHYMFGLPKIHTKSPKRRLAPERLAALRDAVVELSEVVTQSKEPDYQVPKRLATFVVACARQTDNILPRRIRFDALYDEAF